MSALAKKGNSPKNAKQKPTEMQKILNIKMPPKRCPPSITPVLFMLDVTHMQVELKQSFVRCHSF